VVGDLDGDGKAEIMVPYGNAPDFWLAGWVGLEVLDGVTGQSRWRQRLSRGSGGSNEADGVAHFLVGPDLDGDGHREVFTAALLAPSTFDPEVTSSTKGNWLLVAASSGADGRLLWRTLRRMEDADHDLRSTVRLQWCPAGADGWPRLMVSLVAWQTDWRSKGDDFSYGGWSGSTRFSVHAHNLIFSATDGKLQQTLPDLHEVNTADFNGDGLPETYGLRLDETGLAGKLHVLRGDPPERWRRLGTWMPEGSGLHGRTVYCSLPLPQGDLDGDGTADVLVFHPNHWSDPVKPPPLTAYSGKDGHRLWKVSPGSLGVRDQSHPPSYCYSLQCRDLDGDGRPEVIFVYRLGEEGSSGTQGWLAVLSGRNGSVLWKQQLGGFEIRHGGATTSTRTNLQQPIFADLNGDGLPDILVTVQTEVKQQELYALDGRKGRAIWRAALPVDTQAVALACVRTEANADGPVDVVVASRFEREEEIRPDGTRAPIPEADGGPRRSDMPRAETRRTVRVERVQVSLLSGADGQEKWTWSGAEGTEYVYAGPVLADLDGSGRPVVRVAFREKGRETAEILVLDLQGQPRQALRVHAQKDAPFRFWSHDLDGNGREELLLVSDGKVQAVGGNFDKPLWQWPLPGPSGQIVAIRPASDGHRAVVVVLAGKDVYSVDQNLYGLDGANGKPLWQRAVPKDVEGTFRGVVAWQPGTQGTFVWGSPLGFHSAGEPAGDQRPSAPTLVVISAPGIVYGLDSRTGKPLWRCSGPGRVIGLSADDNPGDLPSVWYHTFKPEGTTICRVALPLDASGKCTQPPATPVAFGPPPVDNWVVRPLPWENQARKRLSDALLPGLACLGLVVYCAARRKWWTVIGLVACLLVVPFLVGWTELKSHYLSPEQHYAWESWYLIWPHTLSVPQDIEVASCFWLLGLAAIIAFLFFLPRKCRVPAVIVLLVVLMLCGVVYVLSSHGRVEGKSFWADNWHIPGGLTLKSPLVWMVFWLLFLSARRIRRRGKQPLEPQADALAC
jgi:outer membrane protein assembly factor BamB